MKDKRKILKQLKVNVTSTSEPHHYEAVIILEPYPKEDYVRIKKFFKESPPFGYSDDFIYVNTKTKKLWRVVKDHVPLNEIASYSIKQSLEKGIVIDPYSEKFASQLVWLPLLKESFVFWWCK